MNRLLAATCLAITVFAASGTQAREVLPLVQLSEGVETLRATVGGQAGNYLFDSGLGTTGITPDVASAIHCTPWGKITGFRATGERLDLPHCNGSHIVLGAYQVDAPQLSIFDLAKFLGPLAKGLSGAIGLDVFAGQVVTLDIAKHRITIEDDNSFAAIRKQAVEVPIRMVREVQGAALTVDIGVKTSSGTAWMELDTGNYGHSLIDATIAPLFGLDPRKSEPQPLKAQIPGGIGIDSTAVVQSLIMDGNLGRDVLQHWELTLDLKQGRGWIKVLPSSPSVRSQGGG